jgi:epoxide hydrolase-like predicted phosphatase
MHAQPRGSGPSAPPSALIVDWGGVLTGNLDHSMADALRDSGVDLDAFAGVLADWLGPDAAHEAMINPLHALERGEIGIPHFEERLADELSRRQHEAIDHHGLLQRMFDAIEHAPDMNALVLRAKQSGLATALLSNSWGNEYPRDGWDAMFDVVVISGEVGMRKPEHRIYHHAADQLGVAAADCVFVDDLWPNVQAAAAVGMVGVHHRDYASTAAELDVLFDRALSV